MADYEEYSFSPMRIMVTVDGSDNATRALRAAVELAKAYHSELLIMTVTPRESITVGIASEYPGNSSVTRTFYEQMDKRSDRILSDAADIARKAGFASMKTEAVPEFDSVTKQILEHADARKVDLIVIGTRGLGGFRRLLLGSVSSAVVTHAHCNVMVVR